MTIEHTSTLPRTQSLRLSAIPVLVILLVSSSVWAVWPRLLEMGQVWTENPTYSHGYLVPLFSLFLLWSKRQTLATLDLKPSWWGLLLIALAIVFQFSGVYLFIAWLEGAALPLFLAGVAVVLGGWPLLKATWQAIAFLLFMIPLPWTVESALRGPLRLFAANISNILLQICGLPSTVEDTVIDISGQKLGVEEACSGIAMLMTFFALATGFTILVRRPWLDKLIILLSALPIAIICNVIRITITGLLYYTVGEKWGKFVYHDLAGLLMMPMGIGFLWLELFILDHLLVEPNVGFSEQPLNPFVIPGAQNSFRETIGPT